jgi:hypothetical protein
MQKALKTTYITTKWLLYIGIISFLILLEKYFIGITSYSNELAAFIDIVLLYSGFGLMMFAILYIPIAFFIFVILWINLKIKKISLYVPAVFGLKNNLKWLVLCVVGGILILFLTTSLLENQNSLKVINATDVTIRNVDIDGYDFSKRFFINEFSSKDSKTFEISHSNWWRNEDDYEITYELNGDTKTIQFVGNLGISVVYLK